MKISNKTDIANYRVSWLVKVVGREEPFELSEEQYSAVKDAVAEGKSMVFFKEFAIGLPLRYAEMVRTPIVEPVIRIAIDHEGNPIP